MEVRKADVLVIGSGGAGVMAAVEAKRAGASVIVASKEPLGYGDTRIALGIMSTSPNTAAEDSEEAFVEDMIRGGEYLNERKLVRALVGDAMDATLTFEGFGHIFSRDSEGSLSRMALPPGGHRASRAISSPWLGVSMCHAMRSAAARAHVEVLEETVCSEEVAVIGAEHDDGILKLAALLELAEKLTKCGVDLRDQPPVACRGFFFLPFRHAGED